jgi:glycosyltransferase involved in cell wall biosynthesis
MPVFNGELHLRQAILSLIDQSFDDFKLVISDNSSTDATEDICREFERLDNRIEYFRQPENLGGAKNWNFVAKNATGKFFKWASANDLHHKSFVERCIDHLRKTDNSVLCYTETILVDSDGNEKEQFDDPLDASSDCAISRFQNVLNKIALNNAQIGVVRSSVLRQTKLEGLYPGGDVPLMAELALHGKFERLPDRLYFRRMTVDSATQLAGESGLQHFFQPGRDRPIQWKLWPGYIDLFRRTLTGPISAKQKLKLTTYLVRTMYWRKRELMKEFVPPNS